MYILKKEMYFILITAIGFFLLVASIKDKVEFSKAPADIEYMTRSDFYNGRFVDGNLYELWGEYATLQTSEKIFGITYNTKTSAHYFLMPLETSYETNDLVFVSVAIKEGADYTTAKKMAEEFEDYLNDYTYPETVMPIKGKITLLSGKGKDIFDDTLTELGFSPALNGTNFVINVGNDGSGSTIGLLISIGIMVVGIVGGLFMLIREKNRGY